MRFQAALAARAERLPSTPNGPVSSGQMAVARHASSIEAWTMEPTTELDSPRKESDDGEDPRRV